MPPVRFDAVRGGFTRSVSPSLVHTGFPVIAIVSTSTDGFQHENEAVYSRASGESRGVSEGEMGYN